MENFFNGFLFKLYYCLVNLTNALSLVEDEFIGGMDESDLSKPSKSNSAKVSSLPSRYKPSEGCGFKSSQR